MCEGLYHPSQFNFISYHSSAFSGQLHNADSMARVSYYSATSLPEVDFDATHEMVGASTAYRDGSYYIPWIDNHLTQSVPVKVQVPEVSYESGNAYVDVVITLYGDLASIAGTYVRVAVVEDVLRNGTWYENVVRDMVPTPTGTALTIQHTGEVQTLHLPFTMGTWNPEHMAVVAFVQRDSDKYIYNSGSSQNQPYYVTVGVDGAQQILAFGEPLVFGNTTIRNFGTETDTYDITLDISALPAGWDAYFTHDGVDAVSTTVTLDQFETTSLFVTIIPAGGGDGSVSLDIFSQGAGEVVESLEFAAVNGNAQVLVVADDGPADLAEPYVVPAIEAAGRTVARWDQASSAVTTAVLNNFDAVVWLCGGENPGLTSADRSAIGSYLLAGGRAVLSGQDIAQDLQAQGGSALAWLEVYAWCYYVAGNSNNTTINGVVDDPIGDGLSFAIAGGDGADNQTDPDVIQAANANAVPVFNYGSGTLAGVRVEGSAYKLVYLAFGFEGIATSAMRNEVMDNTLTWLIGDPSTPVQDAPRALALAPNTPNPFNPLTKIAFALDRNGPVRLEVYDLQGRLVRTLASEPMTAGEHTLVWDGRDDANQQAASGTYVYRLTADGTTLSRKMTLVK